MTRITAILLPLVLLALFAGRATAADAARTEPVVTPEEEAILRQAVAHADSDPSGAIAILRRNLRSGSSAALDFTLGGLLMKNGRDAEAEEAFAAATEKLDGFARAWIALGRVRLALERPADAAPALVRGIELGRGEAANWKFLGYARLATGHPLAAEAAYRTALALAPEDDRVRLGLVRALLASGQTRAAIPLLEAQCDREPERQETWLLLANARLAEEQPGLALEVLETARRITGLPPDAWLTLGDLCYRKGLYAEAARWYGKVPQAELSAERVLNCAQALFALGRTEEAAKLLEGGAADADRPARHHLLAGRIARKRGDVATAEAEFRAALRADPLDGAAMLDLAGLLLDRGGEGDREQARLVLERASRRATVRDSALVLLARIEVEAGRYEPAIEYLEQAIELHPSPRLTEYLEQIRRIAAARR